MWKGSRIKKITPDKVKRAIDGLLERKELVSARSVRDEIGYGSFSTISRHLKEISEKEDFSSNYDTKIYIAQTLENISQQSFALAKLVHPSTKNLVTNNSIFLLVYKSKAGPNFKGINCLKEIEAESITNNSKKSVSGLLLFSKDQFLHILEGEAFELVCLYQAILQDPRNRDNKLLCFIENNDRILSDWPMRTSRMSHEIFLHCDKILSTCKKQDSKFLINSLSWIAKLAGEYPSF